MRVAYVAPSLDDTTGWGRWINDLLRHVRELGVEPVILAPPSSKRHLASEFLKLETHFVLPELFDYVQSADGLQRLRNIAAFWKLSGGLKADLVHSLDAHPWGLYGHILAKNASVPHVITTHGRYGYIAENRPVDRWLYSRVLKAAALVIPVSQAVGRAIGRSFSRQLPEKRICVLQNPVDPGQFATGGALPAGVPDRGPLILSVTRFTPVKDIETAVRAFALVKQQVTDAIFCIVGPGNNERNSYFRLVRDVIAECHTPDLHVVGRVDKATLSTFYRRASVLLHTARTLPDDFEASGLILLEAGLFDVPVVASASGGIGEVVLDGQTGFLVSEREPNEVATALIRVLGDPVLRSHMGKNNRERALSRNWPAYAQQQVEQYRRLLSLKGIP